MKSLEHSPGMKMNHESFELSLEDGHIYAKTHRPVLVEHQNGKLFREMVMNDTTPVTGFQRLTRMEAASLIKDGHRIGLPVLKTESSATAG